MLVGQDIGLVEVIWISLFGMAVATIAIIILMIFVIIISKIISQGRKAASAQKTVSEKAVSAQVSQTPAVPDPSATEAAPVPVSALQSTAPSSVCVTEDEVASITAALCVETGMHPEQFRIVSITSR